MTVPQPDIERCVMQLLGERAVTSSICPSDVARSLLGDQAGWRALMPSIREVAARLAREGRVLVTQGGVTLDPDETFRGPIRLRRGPKFATG
jgi:hypothetical protein